MYYKINTRLEDFVKHQWNYLNGKGRIFRKSPCFYPESARSRLSIRVGDVERSKWRMRGGGVRHPERAQRNIRLVLLRGAGGLGVSPRSTIEPSESAVPLGGKGTRF
jgi:hypothetical protein